MSDFAPRDDVRDVLRTAEVLEITEYEVFEAAYTSWYHEPAVSLLLERHFVRYMFHGVAPFWVRHFTRAALRNPRRGGNVVAGRGNSGRIPTHGTLCTEVKDFLLVAAMFLVSPVVWYGDSRGPHCMAA